MCSADVTPNVWKWNPGKRIAEIQFNNVHTCVDWDKLKEWAQANQAPVKFSDVLHTQGELVPVHKVAGNEEAEMGKGHEHDHHHHQPTS